VRTTSLILSRQPDLECLRVTRFDLGPHHDIVDGTYKMESPMTYWSVM
jgi:hypothetical protein